MKSIILAGGSGSRLYPTAVAINKHFFPIYNKPMIYYPLSILMLTGIREVLIVSNPEDLNNYRKLFGNGSKLGMNILFAVQEKPRGLADGLIVGEDFIGEENVCMILGDNIFFGHGLPNVLLEAKREIEEKEGAYIFGYYVPDPHRYGIVEFNEKEEVLSVEEKPKNPKSNYAIVGLYFYDKEVVQIAKRIQPSWRGELEITSINEEYLKRRKLKIKLLGRGFAWFDAGTHDSFLEAGEFVCAIEKRTGLMIGCIEEIAYRNEWIDKREFSKLIEPLKKTDYGEYLLRIIEEK